ncbi:MAG: hypothetical protein HY063_11795 [Bacteroidetes bacterium]|nr:hypothetical protein [Bacteroidota bacterium]
MTTAKGIAPAVLRPILFTLEAHAVISNLPSAAIIGIQHASITSVKHTKKTTVTETKTSKTTSKIALSKAGHPLFNHTTDDHYQWTDFIYVVIS